MVYVLKIPYNATVALQNPNILLSDVFGIWTKMQLHLEACAEQSIYKTKMSNYLLTALNARKDTIFRNSQMECCLFLDPRFCGHILNDNDATKRAKTNLVNIWRRINFLEQTNNSVNEAHALSDFHFSFDEDMELNKLLSQIDSSIAHICSDRTTIRN